MRRAATALLLLVLCAPVRADALEHRVLLRRAEVAERALGDLIGAAGLYREAAAAADAAVDRARAEIRAASCLSRAGRSEEALSLARPWLTPPESEPIPDEIVALAKAVVRDLDATQPATEGPPVVPSGAASDLRLVAELEAEAEQLRLGLEQAADREKGVREDYEQLAVRLRATEEELARQRERQPSPDLGPDELLALRQREVAAQRRRAKRDARIWTNLARLHHQAGRFAEARAALRDALLADKDDPEANALLGFVSAPYGDREQLYLRTQEVLALAREVRAARIAVEAEVLVRQARLATDSGNPSSAAPLLERALALVDSAEAGRRAPARLREEIVGGLRRTEAAGIGRSPQPAPPPSPLGERWTEALLALLQEAGAEVAGGLTLRFHDLQPALPAMARALPPAPLTAPPAGWTLRATDVAPAPLVAAWLTGDERAVLSTAGARADLAGGTLVMVAPTGPQERVSSRLSGAALAGPRAAEVEVVLLREEPGALLTRLRARGLAPFEQAGGGNGAVLPPAEVAALLSGGGDGLQGDTLVHATFRATHLRPFRLTRRDGDRVLTLDVLPVAGTATGVAIGVGTTWEHVGAGGVPLSAQVVGGGSFARGGALVLGGLPDPADRTRSLTAIVRVGRESALAPLPAAGSTGPAAATAPAGMRVAEHRVPHVIASLEDAGELPLAAAGDRFPSREQALRGRLEAVAQGAASVELSGDRVIVVGPQAAQDAVAGFLGRLGAVRGLQTLQIELHSLSADDAEKLVELVPTLARAAATEGIAQTLVTERSDQSRISWLLTSRSRRIALLQSAVSAPPTGRDHAGHVVRSPFRADLGAVPGDPEAWGRAEEGVLETGVVVAVRPFGRSERGRDDVDVHLRSVRLGAAGESERDTPLGDVPVLVPEIQGLAATVRAQIGPRDVLLLTTPHDPFAGDDEGSLLVVVLRRGR